jgi:hypothetical protein
MVVAVADDVMNASRLLEEVERVTTDGSRRVLLLGIRGRLDPPHRLPGPGSVLELLELHSVIGLLPETAVTAWQQILVGFIGRKDLMGRFATNCMKDMQSANYCAWVETPGDNAAQFVAQLAEYASGEPSETVGPSDEHDASATAIESDPTFASSIDALLAGGQRRIWKLEDIVHDPTADRNVAATIEATLDDRTPCRIEQYYLGEVHLLAGLALLTERAVQGEAAPLRLRCVPPVTTGDLMALLEAVGIAWPEPAGDEDAALIAFGLARDRGIVVEEELELRFPVDLAALAAAWRPSVALQQDHGPATSADPVAGPDARSPATVRAATEEDVRYYLDVLTRGERDDRVFALRNLAGAPTGDARVRLALEPLLADTTPCVLQIPYRFGELRLLAGAALAAERWAAGDEQPVRLRCVAPLTPDELEALRYAAGAPLPPPRTDPIEQQLELFALLRDRRLMPELELELRHPVQIGWLGVQSSLPS